MQTPSGQTTADRLRTLVADGTLAGEWTLDPGKSSIRLKSKSYWGLAPVNGVFREVSGNGTVAADGAVSGTVTVVAASVDTKVAKRDKHLRSADFFDTDNTPHITVAINGIQPAEQGVTVTGSLTVRDRTRPLSFAAAVSLDGDAEITFDAEIPVNRADFGLTWNSLGMASMDNTITIHAVFTRG